MILVIGMINIHQFDMIDKNLLKILTVLLCLIDDQIKFEKDFKGFKKIFQDTQIRNFHLELRTSNGYLAYK